MNWKTFKDEVEKLGVKDEDDIKCIDVVPYDLENPYGHKRHLTIDPWNNEGICIETSW